MAKTVKRIRRIGFTFYVKHEDSSYSANMRPDGGDERELEFEGCKSWGTEKDAILAVRRYCRANGIKHKPIVYQQNNGPRGSEAQWKRAAEMIAAIVKGSDPKVWLPVLSLQEMPTTELELKKAYRKAMLEAHPDHGGSDEAVHGVTDAYNNLRALMGL